MLLKVMHDTKHAWLLFFFALNMIPVLVRGQQNDADKYASTITRYDLKRQLQIVAGAGMEGRETSTEGQRKAAEYIEKQYRMLGLQPAAKLNSYQQSYPLYKDSLLKGALKVGKEKYEYGIDYIAIVNASNNAEIRSKKIIFVGYGISSKLYDDYEAKDVKGKTVIFFSGEPVVDGKYILSGTTRPSSWSRSSSIKKLTLAKQKGAVAAFIINATVDTFSTADKVMIHRTSIYYPAAFDRKNAMFNAAIISRKKGEKILGTSFAHLFKRAAAGELLNNVNHEVALKIKFEIKKLKDPFPSTNVIGLIEGTDKKDEYVFLTAHYDHIGKHGDLIYYGADDDGSGTVSVIEMAEAFSKARSEGKGPRRTVVFMAVSGEEEGLLGSQYYSENPVFPLEKTSVDLNTDMVGRIGSEYLEDKDSANYVYVIGDDKLSSDLAAITDKIGARFGLKLDKKYNDLNDPNRFYYRSDHYNFASKGVPIIFYFNGTHADYHGTGDTVDKINFGLMEKRVRFIFLTAWEMANRDDMLKRDIPFDMPAR